MSHLFLPSYAQGFADSADESENPGLWDSLVSAWSPALGPTGTTMREMTAGVADGAIQGPAWASWRGEWSLDCSTAAGNEIDVNEPDPRWFLTSDADPFTIWMRLYCKGDVSGYQNLCAVGVSDMNYQVYLADGTLYPGWYSGSAWTISTQIPLNQWFNLAYVRKPDGDADVYFGGAFQGTMNAGLDTTPSTDTLRMYGWANSNEFNGYLSQMAGWNRMLTADELQQLADDPAALYQPRRRVFAAAPAPVGVAPTGTLYGPLVGPLGGVI